MPCCNQASQHPNIASKHPDFIKGEPCGLAFWRLLVPFLCTEPVPCQRVLAPKGVERALLAGSASPKLEYAQGVVGFVFVARKILSLANICSELVAGFFVLFSGWLQELRVARGPHEHHGSLQTWVWEFMLMAPFHIFWFPPLLKQVSSASSCKIKL